jgi:hypothetical protein
VETIQTFAHIGNGSLLFPNRFPSKPVSEIERFAAIPNASYLVNVSLSFNAVPQRVARIAKTPSISSD